MKVDSELLDGVPNERELEKETFLVGITLDRTSDDGTMEEEALPDDIPDDREALDEISNEEVPEEKALLDKIADDVETEVALNVGSSIADELPEKLKLVGFVDEETVLDGLKVD